MALPVLAIDVDEVLAQYLYSCNEWHNRVYKTSHTLADYKSYKFCETWGCTDEEARQRVYAFYACPEFQDLPVVPGAREAIENLSRYFTLVVVTSRQEFIKDITLKWLKKHFGDVFQEVLFGNVWVADSGAKRRTKADMCQSVNAIALIDDLPCYIFDVAKANITPILLDRDGAQGWSKIPATIASAIPKLSICRSWKEVEQICLKLVEEPQIDKEKEIVATSEQKPVEGIEVRAV